MSKNIKKAPTPRGKSALGILVIDGESPRLAINAELLAGAQINRSDRLVFSRQAACTNKSGTYTIDMKVILTTSLRKYLRALKAIAARLDIDGAVISMASGHFEMQVSISESERSKWKRARSGTAHRVVGLWIDIENFALGDFDSQFPLGFAASLNCSVRFTDLI